MFIFTHSVQRIRAVAHFPFYTRIIPMITNT